MAVAEEGEGTINNNIDEDTEENNCILNEVRNNKAVKRSVEKENIQNKIARHLKDISSPTKHGIIKNILPPLSLILAAVNSSSNSSPSS